MADVFISYSRKDSASGWRRRVMTKRRGWDATSGQELLTLRGHDSKVLSVAWSPDGKRLASSGEDGIVQIYAMDIHDLLNLARSRVTRDLTPDECLRYFQSKSCPPLPQ